MPVTRLTWILVGVFLWALPTAVFFSLVMAVLKPGVWLEAQPFEKAAFIRTLIWTVPLAVLLGMVYGNYMYQRGRSLKRNGS